MWIFSRRFCCVGIGGILGYNLALQRNEAAGAGVDRLDSGKPLLAAGPSDSWLSGDQSLPEIADTLPYIENFSMANPNVCEDDYTFFRDGQKYINFRRLENTWLFGNAWPDKRTVAKYCPDMHVDAQTPPAFIWHTMQDNLVFPENSIRFAQALREAGVDCELHLFSEGFHGLSLANEVSALREGDVVPSCQMWIQLAQNWIQG